MDLLLLSLQKVQICFSDGWVGSYSYFVVVEQNPLAILVHVGYIVATVDRGALVRDKGIQLVIEGGSGI